MSAKLTGLCVGIVLVICSLAASIMLGSTKINLQTVIEAFTAFDGSREHLIVRSVRLPRALIAMMVGASLALAGGIMQAMTRNALAGPEVFGINYGAALMAVIAGFLFSHSAFPIFTWSAFLGAGLACLIVFGLASVGQGGLTSMKLVLAGATINLLLASITQGILIFNEQSLDEMRFWLAGSVTGRDLDLFVQIVPYMLAGLLLTLLMGKQINLLSLGDDVAAGLGQRVVWTKAALIGIIMLLAGSAVAIAGPIGFVGLAVPHLARFAAGMDYRWILPYSAILGALLLLLADIGARFVLPGHEVPVGVVTAFLGAPFLIYLAQRKG
ncbi:putative siderophore transport system permease protein YfiZ [Paenibacillus plantiphilus]|uniref:Siderophore transport system permease protein YfiZ n=1 Tax=Paenibacillus plantiphilus TaxID=2905650 RepID=A0ABN8G564_9BACL|nr:iron ABC transporter permease [Paenibacillus plantiphilus]CAH1197611.1 putative siderophore transport system permease protein YfiZ [Paenibacillus plantiphilus]